MLTDEQQLKALCQLLGVEVNTNRRDRIHKAIYDVEICHKGKLAGLASTFGYSSWFHTIPEALHALQCYPTQCSPQNKS